VAALLAVPANGHQRRGGPDLARYAGRYPFDRVAGVRFLEHPRVRQAVATAAPTPGIRARGRFGRDLHVPRAGDSRDRQGGIVKTRAA